MCGSFVLREGRAEGSKQEVQSHCNKGGGAIMDAMFRNVIMGARAKHNEWQKGEQIVC